MLPIDLQYSVNGIVVQSEPLNFNYRNFFEIIWFR